MSTTVWKRVSVKSVMHGKAQAKGQFNKQTPIVLS